MTKPARRHDVVIIGAGIAGLTVTAALAAAGIDVLCLEARDRWPSSAPRAASLLRSRSRRST